MRNLSKKIKVLAGVALSASLAFGLASCGTGGTNNDQGIAETFLGFFSEFPDGCEELPSGLVGGAFPLVFTSLPESLGSENGVIVIMGFQNNLSQVAFRGDRLFYSYDIPGSSVNPPSTTLAVSFLSGPADGEVTPGSSSLPTAFAGICNRSFFEYPLVPADINAWLGLNAANLPEPPFHMYVTVSGSGVTTAGDRYTTNSQVFLIEYTPAVIIPPTEGDDSTSGVIEGEEIVEAGGADGGDFGSEDEQFFE